MPRKRSSLAYLEAKSEKEDLQEKKKIFIKEIVILKVTNVKVLKRERKRLSLAYLKAKSENEDLKGK